MNRSQLNSRARRTCLRRWAMHLGLAGLSWIGGGCAQFAPSALLGQANSPDAAEIVQVRAQAAEPQTAPQPAVAQKHAHVVPISLDTVFRLAEEQNGQIAIARARVDEAIAERDVARYAWLPDLYIGTAFYRHEGGIQDFFGELIHSSTGAIFSGMELDGKFDLKDIAYRQVSAERKAWQQKGELSRITSETLLEATSTYIDLLAARTGEAIARYLEKEMEALLERTRKLAEVEPGTKVEVARIESELASRRSSVARLVEQAEAASYKLIYLLGLDPCVELLPVDVSIVPFDLVDVSPPACDLVDQALANGPGIKEMEGLLGLVVSSMERAKGPGRLLPVFEVRMAEGAFGAGPGANLTWDNRYDLGLQARWNLNQFIGVCERRRVTQAQLEQLHFSHDDLRRKLTAGVQESRAAVLNGRQLISLAKEQIQHARQAYDLSNERLKKTIQGSSPSEVLLSMQSLALAQLNYLNSVREYDKDQLRLMILLGPANCLPPSTPMTLPPEQTANPKKE